MSEDTTPATPQEPAPQQQTPAPQEPDSQEPTPPWGSDDQFDPQRAWNLIQNLRGDLDELKPKAARLKELEDAEKTETQRLSDQLAEESTARQEAERRALVLEIATEKGLTPALAKRLSGSTREELEADADELSALLPPAEDGRTTTPKSRPQESLRPGATPDGTALNGDPLLASLKSKLGIQ